MIKKWLFLFLLTLPYFLLPKPAFAHAFGQLYNLPVPFWMYLYGGAAAIVVSFLIIGYFFNKRNQKLSYSTINLSRWGIFSTLTKEWFVTTIKAVSVFLFLFTILTGLIGENSAYSNFNMTFFWIIFLLGLTYLTALIGNVYAFINPWKVLTEWFENSFGEKASGVIKYPKSLGYYPALFFYFLLIWFELIGQTSPAKLSIILIQYTMINAIGVVAFGKESWFRYAEFSGVFLRLIGKISLVEYRLGKLYLRPPFIGLLKDKAEHFSLLLFTLFMLSSTAFDGFRETTPWVRLYWRNFDEPMRAIFGGDSYSLFQTFGLLASPFVFLIIYLVFLVLARIITKTRMSAKELSLQFAFSLIPIAFVYNIAHYYTLIFTEGPNIMRLISDPFGFGWNLFNTADYYGRFILDANFIWHSQVAFILLGHITGVYLAHVIALNIFPTHKKAFLSQLPMLALMVSYTMIGLWILSQPITSGI